MALMPKLKPGPSRDSKGRHIILSTELMAPHFVCPDHFRRHQNIKRLYSNDTNRLIFFFGDDDCNQFMVQHSDLMRVHGLSLEDNVDSTLFIARPSYFKNGAVTTFDTLNTAYDACGVTIDDPVQTKRQSVAARSERARKRAKSPPISLPDLNSISTVPPPKKKPKITSTTTIDLSSDNEDDISAQEKSVSDRRGRRNRKKKKRRVPKGGAVVKHRPKAPRYSTREAKFYLKAMVKQPHDDVRGLQKYLEGIGVIQQAVSKGMPLRTPGGLVELYVFHVSVF